MRLSPSLPLLLCAALALPACSGNDETPDVGFGPADTGAAEDSGVAVDTGVEADAGTEADAGEVDVGPRDAEPTDAPGPGDAEPMDADPLDAGPMDAPAAADAMTADASPADAAPVDSGSMGPMCDPEFGAAEACGGNLVGTWTYDAACTNTTLLEQTFNFCGPGTGVSNVNQVVSGTLNLDANGTFTRDLSSTTTADLALGGNCGRNCAGNSALIPNLIPGATATCAGAIGNCNCQITLTESVQDTGPYVVAGNTVTTGTGIGSRQYWFCVQGGTLLYNGYDSNTTDRFTTYILTP